MGFELFIAKRYLKSKRRNNFISFTSALSIIGITIGVAALLFVISMMNGFETEVRGMIIDTTAHVTVSSYISEGFTNWREVAEKIEDDPDVIASSPCIYYKTLIRSEYASDGIFVKGILPERHKKVSTLVDNIKAGKLQFDSTSDSLPGILIGTTLSELLGMRVGDKLVLASLKTKGKKLSLQPKYKKFQVTGIFETGLAEYDANLGYISLSAAQDLFNLGNNVTTLQVKVTDFYNSHKIAERLEEKIGSPFAAVDWSETHKSLFNWMTLEKFGMALVVGLIIAVAAFSIVSTLIMLVYEKRRDIAILKSMGCNRKQIMKIFIYKGSILGLVGAASGTFLGFLLCWLQQEFGLISIPGEFYFISELPMDIRPLEFIIVAVSAFMVALAATIYPSRRAAAFYPADILRSG